MSKTRFVAGMLSAAAVALALTPPAGAVSHETHPPAAAAKAPAPTNGALGTAGAWSAYASADKAGRVCYLVGQPQKSESGGVARKGPMAMVTHRTADNISNVVSFVEGYPLKEGSEVTLEIGDKKFELFTKDDSAWARTAELDRTIVATLSHATSAVVKGLPQKGRPTTDVYALAGFNKVLALIDKACGIKREASAAAKRPTKSPKAPKPPKSAPQPAAGARP